MCKTNLIIDICRLQVSRSGQLDVRCEMQLVSVSDAAGARYVSNGRLDNTWIQNASLPLCRLATRTDREARLGKYDRANKTLGEKKERGNEEELVLTTATVPPPQ